MDVIIDYKSFLESIGYVFIDKDNLICHGPWPLAPLTLEQGAAYTQKQLIIIVAMASFDAGTKDDGQGF